MPFLDSRDTVEPLKPAVIEARPAFPGDSPSEENSAAKPSTWLIDLHLSDSEERILGQIRQLLAEHLGSDVAAIAWLNSASTGYPGTALDAIRQGHAALVLEDLKSQWGPGPPYA